MHYDCSTTWESITYVASSLLQQHARTWTAFNSFSYHSNFNNLPLSITSLFTTVIPRDDTSFLQTRVRRRASSTHGIILKTNCIQVIIIFLGPLSDSRLFYFSLSILISVSWRSSIYLIRDLSDSECLFPVLCLLVACTIYLLLCLFGFKWR